MRVSPRTPWMGLCVWTFTFSAILRCGCGARSCSEDAHPKVALLFLTRAGLLHTELWERWLSSAANLTDAAHAQQQLCSREPAEPCERGKQPSYPFGQKLFSVYIHTGVHPEPGSVAAAAQPSNRFAEFYVRSSILTEWGQPTLIMAERLLLQKGLQDRTNQRFVLLSESCIPLYSPQLIYQQLMGELRSRINACRNWRGTDDHVHRWGPRHSSPLPCRRRIVHCDPTQVQCFQHMPPLKRPASAAVTNHSHAVWLGAINGRSAWCLLVAADRGTACLHLQRTASMRALCLSVCLLQSLDQQRQWLAICDC